MNASQGHLQGHLVGIADEYGTIWAGEPGASERIGDLVQRGDEETFEVRLRIRSAASYEREIRALEKALSGECANSKRLADKLGAAEVTERIAAKRREREARLDKLVKESMRVAVVPDEYGGFRFIRREADRECAKDVTARRDGQHAASVQESLSRRIETLERRAKAAGERLSAALEATDPITYETIYWLACGVTDYLTPLKTEDAPDGLGPRHFGGSSA